MLAIETLFGKFVASVGAVQVQEDTTDWVDKLSPKELCLTVSRFADGTDQGGLKDLLII
jgi:hypothetical protein